MKYDLIIIGGGAGGFASAIKASELGIKTLVINKGLPLGGTCVNVGCVPSKFLIYAGELLSYSKERKLKSLDFYLQNFNFSELISEELKLVEDLRKEKYEDVLKSLKVDFLGGKAKFIRKDAIEVNGQIFEASKFIIATGSTAKPPKIEGIERVDYLDHVSILKIKNLPQELIVLGGGAIGLEFGQAFARFGSKVKIIELGENLLPFTEKELSQRLKEILEKEGIEFYLGARVSRIWQENDKKFIEIEFKGEKAILSGDALLISVGKVPNTEDLALEKANVEVNEKKAVKVNEFLQTTNANIYAVGDVNDRPLRLETTAAYEGTISVMNAFLSASLKVNYNLVPFTIFTDPSISGIGYTEERQIKELKTCACRVVDFKMLPKAIIENRIEGMAKMIINPQTKEITGLHILGKKSEEIISQGIWLIKNKITIDEVINSMPVFPSYSEIIKLLALSFYKDLKNLPCCV